MSRKRFQVVTLDLDGTLWDSRPALARAERAVYALLEARCPAITERYTVAALVDHRRELMARRPDLGHDFTRLRHAALVELATAAGAPERLADEAMEVFLTERSRVRMYADTLPALETLRRRYRLVSLTNGNADVGRTAVAHLLERAVSPAETGKAKPDPAVFDFVAAACAVATSAIVHVGDEPHTDIACAQRAGVASVWINRERSPWPQMDPPQAEIASLAALAEVLEQLEDGP
ncbi:MAG: HAD-IA family hydrolase [Gammaproteobacteria bacterium]|nr:HAD-IA family hydrolase [Gammaproteobacteria bacterium]